MPHNFLSIQTGQGLLKNNYGVDDDSQGEALQALQQRAQNMAFKVKAGSPNPTLDTGQQLPPPAKIRR